MSCGAPCFLTPIRLARSIASSGWEALRSLRSRFQAPTRPTPEIRPIRPSDRSACQDFYCGDAEYEVAVHQYLRKDYWEQHAASSSVRVLVAIDESGAIVGYGAWQFSATLRISEPISQVESSVTLARFGIARDYQGKRDGTGVRISERLYSSIEEDVREHPRSDSSMAIFLACDSANTHGRRFWQQMGFEEIGPAIGNLRFIEYVRSPW